MSDIQSRMMTLSQRVKTRSYEMAHELQELARELNQVDTKQVITERGNTYGKFQDGAVIMQSLKAVMRETPGWSRLTDSQREALEMIQHKIGRVLNGDPTHIDNFVDIAGYSELIVQEIKGNKTK